MSGGLNFSWHWSPITLAFLIILCGLYGFGIWWLRKNDIQDRPLKKYQVVAFFTAIGLIALVLLTPLDTIARTQLFTAHMVQAVVLTTLCAPLLLFSCPTWLLEPILGMPILRNIAQVMTNAVIASMIFNLTFLLWHAPRLFNYALMNGSLYHVEMLSILCASLLNWWPLIGPVRELRRLSYPLQMLYAFLDGQPVDVFAFLLVYTGTVFYSHYAIPGQFTQFGISAVADQTAAGALLLIPGLVDLVVMTPLFFRWLGQIEHRTKLDDLKREEEALAELEGAEGQ